MRMVTSTILHIVCSPLVSTPTRDNFLGCVPFEVSRHVCVCAIQNAPEEGVTSGSGYEGALYVQCGRDDHIHYIKMGFLSHIIYLVRVVQNAMALRSSDWCKREARALAGLYLNCNR